jgi:hypothetical protein
MLVFNPIWSECKIPLQQSLVIGQLVNGHCPCHNVRKVPFLPQTCQGFSCCHNFLAGSSLYWKAIGAMKAKDFAYFVEAAIKFWLSFSPSKRVRLMA